MANKRTVLVTGGMGFLGRGVARRFRLEGYEVLGLGHGGAGRTSGLFDHWWDGDVTLPALRAIGQPMDVVVHCASNSSVAKSIEAPLDDFERSVRSTVAVTEFVRTSRATTLIYPSSAAVYGDLGAQSLSEDMVGRPISPYGYHRVMNEALVDCLVKVYQRRAISVRFFSVYGPELQRQLLWDAAGKLQGGSPSVTFNGTGKETRDWLHVDDAASLIFFLSQMETLPYTVVNGAVGRITTLEEVIVMLRNQLSPQTEVVFNGLHRIGDPRFFNADVSRLKSLGWVPAVSLEKGIAELALTYRDRER